MPLLKDILLNRYAAALVGVLLAWWAGTAWYTGKLSDAEQTGATKTIININGQTSQIATELRNEAKEINATIDSKSSTGLDSMFDTIPTVKTQSSGETFVSGGVEATTDDTSGQSEDKENEQPTQTGVAQEQVEPKYLLPTVCPPVWSATLMQYIPVPCQSLETDSE